MTRGEHLSWAKQRALEYLPSDPHQALASVLSDIDKHPETVSPVLEMLAGKLVLSGALDRPEEVRRFIEGIN